MYKRQVEERVNDKLRDNLAVTTKEMKFDDAIALGAMHLFGEKYGDIVRVVSIGEDGWSRELCGGTHVDHVGKIGMVNILSEASIGSGVRRVDAVVGQGAYDFNAREHALVSQLSDKLNARPDELAERVNALLAKLKESDRRLASMYESQLAASVPALVADTKNSAAPVKVAVKNVGHFGAVDALRKTVLDVRAQLGEDAPVVVALAGVNEDDKPMVAVATNEAARKAGIKAGDLVRGAAKVLGGGGGGTPATPKVEHKLYINGFTDGMFHAERNITREQTAKMLIDALEKETAEPEQSSYTDVANNRWSYRWVEAASKEGYMVGYNGGVFKPKSAITRAEMATALSRIAAKEGLIMTSSTKTFSDVADGKWYSSYIRQAVQYGLISGYTDGTFRPEQY